VGWWPQVHRPPLRIEIEKEMKNKNNPWIWIGIAFGCLILDLIIN